MSECCDIVSPIFTTYIKMILICWLLFPILSIADESHEEVILLDKDIIELPAGRFPEPECGYNVHLNDRRGPKLSRQVNIGEPLYHRWSCDYGAQHARMYCMMVYNCTVSSTRINSSLIPIIDEFGCSLFPTLIPHVSYVDDLDAGLKSNAFSLDVDESAVTFNCNIKLLLKLHGICRRPQCIPTELYTRRAQSNRQLFFV